MRRATSLTTALFLGGAAFLSTPLPATAGTGEVINVNAQEWTFHYTAFLKKKAPSANLELDFYDGKDLKGNPGLTGVDTSAPVLEGDLTISENDGPAKGHKYTVKLVATVNNKDVVLASTTLTMN